MSFDYNPFEHIELIKSNDHDESTFYNYWIWHCHACGANGKMPSDEVNELYADFKQHIYKSHNRTYNDFEGWGKY